MRVVGIVSEYNPFHNGHKYQIEATKEALDADYVVAVMSGNFTQRGEIAVFDMHKRAQTACQNGVDVVLELPPQFVLNSAQFYAYYALSLMESIGCIDYLSFGSECGNLEELKKVLEIDEDKLRTNLKSGMTYAKSVSDSPLLHEPNNILGVEYLRALKQLHSTIIPFTLKRKAVSHHANLPDDKFASASFIRQELRAGNDVSKYAPVIDSVPSNEKPVIHLLNYHLSQMTSDELAAINNISEGLQNRILQNRGKSSLSELIEAIKCKRYPETRIRRALYCILLNIKKDLQPPQYTRVLAFSERGQALLRKMKQTTSIPIYSRLTKKDILSSSQLKKEISCNEIYSIIRTMNQ